MSDSDFISNGHVDVGEVPQVRVDDDFILENNDKLSGLVNAIFDTTIGKNRRAILTPEQAVNISRARAFARIYDVPELDFLCDLLSDTTVSVKGTGLKQLVSVLAARMTADDGNDDLQKLRSRLMG